MKRQEDLTFNVQAPMRLDTFLAQKLQQTRSQIATLVKKEGVRIDGVATYKPGHKLKEHQSVTLTLPQPKQTPPQTVDFDVEVLYEDDALMVINKPSGVTVHDAPSVKEATLVDWLKQRGVSLSTISGEERHGIVHRLDKGTSGAMLVAKTNEAHKELAEQLEDKTMGRYYLAVITPPLKECPTIVEAPIGRNPSNRIKMACIAGGKAAKSAFAPLALSNDQKEQLIAAKLFTGRTHQIRVHLEKISRHIVGDNVYGAKIGKGSAEHILLHAYIIYFRHPSSGEFIRISAQPDAVFLDYLNKKFPMETLDETILPKNIIASFNADPLCRV